MRCPYCGGDDTAVKDSRASDTGTAIRRRRACPACGARFSTVERVQLRPLTVIKRDGRRVPFDSDKLSRAVTLATRKRGIEPSAIERLVAGVARRLEMRGEAEVDSRLIGALTMKALKDLDEVAYVRFASVYKDFTGVKDFEQFIIEMAAADEATPPENARPPRAGAAASGKRPASAASGKRAGAASAEAKTPARRLRPAGANVR